eukprot:5883303-Ditylum_brightwellii.AAC.1
MEDSKTRTKKDEHLGCPNNSLSSSLREGDKEQEEETESYLISCHVWDVPVFCMSDKGSTRTAPSFKPYHVMKAAAKQWHCLDNTVKAV